MDLVEDLGRRDSKNVGWTGVWSVFWRVDCIEPLESQVGSVSEVSRVVKWLVLWVYSCW